MQVVHVGPAEGPHIPVTTSIPYDDHLYVSFPPAPRGQDRFRHRAGFMRKLLRTYAPKILAVHWDLGIQAAITAARFEGGKVVVHRYLDQPLKSGIFRRQMYKKIAAFVVDGARGRQHLEAVKVPSPVLTFRPPPCTPDPSGTKMGKNNSLTFGVPDFRVSKDSLGDIRSCLELLVHGGDRRWVLYEGVAHTRDNATRMPWADVLHLSDILIFFGPPAETYPRRLVQALELGKRCLCVESGVYLEFAGDSAHFFPRPLPGYIVKAVDADYAVSPPDVSKDFAPLNELYKEIA